MKHATSADVVVAFEVVTNVINPLPVLMVEANGRSYESNDRYSLDLRLMTARLCVALDHRTDIAKRLPDCHLVLRLSVDASMNFSALHR